MNSWSSDRGGLPKWGARVACWEAARLVECALIQLKRGLVHIFLGLKLGVFNFQLLGNIHLVNGHLKLLDFRLALLDIFLGRDSPCNYIESI